MAHVNSHPEDMYQDDKLNKYLNTDDPDCDDDDEKMEVTLPGQLVNAIAVFATVHDKPHFRQERKNELALHISLKMAKIVDSYLLLKKTSELKGE